MKNGSDNGPAELHDESRLKRSLEKRKNAKASGEEKEEKKEKKSILKKMMGKG